MIIACDVDHTLRHAAWRDDLIPANPSDCWDSYHDAMGDDKPATNIINLLIALHNVGHEVYIVTAIPRKWLRMLYSWLHKNGVCVDQEHILMRADNCFRPTVEVKQELLAHLQLDLLIEDRVDVCEAFAKDGITTLQVRLVS